MTTQTEALTLADALSELLESFEKDGRFCKSSSIRNELYDRLKQTLEESKEALAQSEQRSNEHLEPVAWIYHDAGSLEEMLEAERKCLNIHSVLLSVRRHEAYRNETPLYTTPPQRTWVGLTDEERMAIPPMHSNGGQLAYAEAIEAKLKEKNT